MFSRGIKRWVKIFKRRVAWQIKAARARRAGLDRRGEKTVVFVTGVQRSGTNMLMQALERNAAIDVYHEGDRRAFKNYQMKPETIIRSLMAKSPFPIVAVKALLEGHKVDALLETFSPARAIWMFRHYDDVINSSLKNWPGWRNKIEEVMADREKGDWRGLGMTDATGHLVSSLYRPDLDDASVNGLFWLYRNQLYFDQKFDNDPRVLLMSYEWLVQNVEPACHAVCSFANVGYDSAMGTGVRSSSIRKNAPLPIDPDIRAQCEAMYDRLTAVWLESGIEAGSGLS